MDRIAAIAARVADLEARFGVQRAPVSAPAADATFAAVLAARQAEMSSSARGPGAPSTVASPTSVAPSWTVVPAADPRSYPNGAVPDAALAPIGVGDHRLAPAAARAWRALTEAAAADGVTIGIISSYRSLAEQAELVRRFGLYAEGGRAAAPGTSNHGWGLAVDVDVDDVGQAWLRAHAGRFGFHEDVPREPWHWTYRS